MVDFCASDAAFLTFIATSIASAMLLAPLSDASPGDVKEKSPTNSGQGARISTSRPMAFRGIPEDLARVGAGLKTIRRLVAQVDLCRDNAPP